MARIYLEHLGVRLDYLCSKFQRDHSSNDPSKGNPSDFAIASEYLRISPQEYDILLGKDPPGVVIASPSSRFAIKVREYYGMNNLLPPVLKLGDSGPEVEALQIRFNALGISSTPLVVDGKFQEDTRNAVLCFSNKKWT